MMTVCAPHSAGLVAADTAACRRGRALPGRVSRCLPWQVDRTVAWQLGRQPRPARAPADPDQYRCAGQRRNVPLGVIRD